MKPENSAPEVYELPSGGWIYVVFVGTRPVVVGWSTTRERAEHAAALA